MRSNILVVLVVVVAMVVPGCVGVQCPLQCPVAYHNPVCSNDMTNHWNPCALENERICNGRPNLSLLYCGNCTAPTGKVPCCPFLCPDIDHPVYGTNGKHYKSPCLLEEDRICNSVNVQIAYYGKGPSCPHACPTQFDPVCGNDGVTYPNLCELEGTRDCHNRPYLRAVYNGGCNPYCLMGPTVCPVSPYDKPLCGSDRRTYPNVCSLNMARMCYDPSLFQAYDGVCLS